MERCYGTGRDLSVVSEWNQAIGKLGIEPVFPPEEDTYVGDVFAVITVDRRRPSHEDAAKSRLVDYFREEDRQGAQAIADLINEMLPPGLSKLAPRLQLVSNPPGFIGVWLPAQVTGWYYLGKLSGDRKQWLESSAADTLTFSLPVEPGRDIVEQLKNPAIEVSSKGYKYLRTTDSTPGHRVNGKVSMTLAPKVRVRIKEIDATGVDPADGQTVLWALIEIVR